MRSNYTFLQLLSFCTDQLAIRYNETIAAFLNVTFVSLISYCLHSDY